MINGPAQELDQAKRGLPKVRPGNATSCPYGTRRFHYVYGPYASRTHGQSRRRRVVETEDAFGGVITASRQSDREIAVSFSQSAVRSGAVSGVEKGDCPRRA